MAWTTGFCISWFFGGIDRKLPCKALRWREHSYPGLLFLLLMGTQLFISMIVSTIGAGYFIYGKKQSEVAFMICGILLCVYTYFITGTEIVLVLGGFLMYLPFGLNRFFGF